LSNIAEFPTYVTDFLSDFKDFKAADLTNPEVVTRLLRFRGSRKKHWQTVLGLLAAKSSMVSEDLNQYLNDWVKAKKLAEKKEKKKQSVLAKLPADSHMNYRWEEDQDGELIQTPKLTCEMWNGLSPVFIGKDGTQWPINIRDQLLFWDEKNSRPMFIKPDKQALDFFSTLAAKNHTVFWEENKAKGFMQRAEFVDGLKKILTCYTGYSDYPHFPPVNGYFYRISIKNKNETTGKLEELLNMLSPASQADRDKIKALFCTLFWGGPQGQRPMFTVVTDAIIGQASGKSTIIEIASQLISGHTGGYIKFSPESGSLDGEKFKTRILGSNGQRIIFFDNVRTSVLGSGYLEDFITSKMVSGHKLHIGYDEMPNYFTVCATFNDSMLTRDIVTRSMILVIKPYDKKIDGAKWQDDLNNILTKHKEDIITDIKLTLAKESKKLIIPPEPDGFRFQPWARDVLSKCTDDLNILISNNDIAYKYNAENEEADKLHEDILAQIARYKIDTLLETRHQHLDWDEFPLMSVRIAESLFLKWVCESLGFKSSRLAKKKLSQLNLPWLAKKDGITEISKSHGGKFYIYGNPKTQRKLAFKITNSDPFLGQYKDTRFLRENEKVAKGD
jgi:hypothetical protein